MRRPLPPRRDGSRRRLTQIGDATGHLGFTADGRYLLATDGTDLLFHDWSAGTTFEVPFSTGTVDATWVYAVNG